MNGEALSWSFTNRRANVACTRRWHQVKWKAPTESFVRHPRLAQRPAEGRILPLRAVMAGGLSLSLRRQVVTHITAENVTGVPDYSDLQPHAGEQALLSGLVAGALHDLQSRSGNHVAFDTPHPGWCVARILFASLKQRNQECTP